MARAAREINVAGSEARRICAAWLGGGGGGGGEGAARSAERLTPEAAAMVETCVAKVRA